MYRIGEEEVEEVRKVIHSKQLFRMGNPKAGHLQEVTRFEEELAEKVGTRYALCVTSGTAALMCGLVGLGIGPGDEVIVPGYTFMASAFVVLAVGAIPVIAEIDDSLTIDPVDIERKITPQTKAVIPVHMVGLPCDMKRIMNLAKKHNLKVLEDSCQADGGSYRNKRLGSFGNAGAFSFNWYKIISSGDGGALVTDDRTIYERALVYHDGGISFRPETYTEDLRVPPFVGSNFRASEPMGAILRIQLKRLDGILSDLRRVKRKFIKKFSGHPKLKFIKSNDLDGDCGVVVGFLFNAESDARSFAKSEGVQGWLPIDSGKHVYSNWEMILQKRGAHHPALNPFNLLQNQGLRTNYSKDMCPQTLDILRRTVFIDLNPDWTEKEIDFRISSCQKAAEVL